MRWIALLLILSGAFSLGHAQSLTDGTPIPEADSPNTDGTEATESPAATPTEEVVPACALRDGTTIVIEILDHLDASTLSRGDRFRLALAEPVQADGVELLPAGIEGVGEVIHAERARGGGKAAELIIAARHLDLNGTSIPLRGLKFGSSGRDNTGRSAQLSSSLAAVVPLLAPIGSFIRGGNIEIPAGTHVTARLAKDLRLLESAAESVDSGDLAPIDDDVVPEAERTTTSPTTVPPNIRVAPCD